MRETVEASLLIGILFACLERTENRRYFTGIWVGAGTGTLASILLGAVVLLTLGSLTGPAEEVFEGVLMWAAAAVLTYVIWWMRRQGGAMAGALRGRHAAGGDPRRRADGVAELVRGGRRRRPDLNRCPSTSAPTRAASSRRPQPAAAHPPPAGKRGE